MANFNWEINARRLVILVGTRRGGGLRKTNGNIPFYGYFLDGDAN